MHAHECVSFLLIDEDNILLEKRSMTKESDPGLIAIPGGHIEAGESQQEALVRELDEELTVTPLTSVYLCSLYHPTTTELQLIHYYVIPSWTGEISAQEAEAVSWHPIVDAPVDVVADRIALGEYLRLADILTSS